MENQNEFNQKLANGEQADQFKIEVNDANQIRVFGVRSLGNERYELLEDEQTIGTIQLDERDHAHCESQGCEIDLPVLHHVRDQIKGYIRSKRF
jgi:hypothetical protein